MSLPERKCGYPGCDRPESAHTTVAALIGPGHFFVRKPAPRWTDAGDDDGTGTCGQIIPQRAFDVMIERAGPDVGGLLLTADLAEALYPKVEYLRDEEARTRTDRRDSRDS